MQNVKRIYRRYCWLIAVALVAISSGQDSKDLTLHGKRQGRDTGSSIFEHTYSCKGTPDVFLSDNLTVLDFTIGASTIRDLQKRFPGTLPMKLTEGEEAEEGICLKNQNGAAVVFATSVMGAPDTLTSIYLAPASLIENGRMACKSVKLPTNSFSSKTNIRVGATAAEVSTILRSKVPNNGPFCVAYDVPSSEGPLQHGKGDKLEGFTDFTGAEGIVREGRVKWVKLFGITSN